MNFPNILTIGRLLLVPFFIYSLVKGMDSTALILFTIAVCTDAFDGYIARIKKIRTPLGCFLDPMADKFLLVSSFIIFAILKRMPLWVTIIIVVRDLIVFFGWGIASILTGKSKIEPSISGKIATILQMVTVFIILLNFPSFVKTIIIILMIFFTVLSGLHYIISGIKDFLHGETW